MPFEAREADNFALAKTERGAAADKVSADAHHLHLSARFALDLVVDHRSVAAHQLDEPLD